jgi:hypothetical protein
MKIITGILAALSLLLTALSAQAYYTVSGDFTGAVDYYSGQKDFFRNTSILDVEHVSGTFDFTTTREVPQPYAPGSPTYDIRYYGQANYSFSLLDASGNSLFSYMGSGAPAYLDVVNYVNKATYSVNYGMDMISGTSIGGNYTPGSFSASANQTSPNSSFSFNFINPASGKPGNISGDFTTSSVIFSPAVAFTAPPLPTPIPAALPLFVSGLAFAGILRKKYS